MTSPQHKPTGPLAGTRIVEVEGLGGAPFACMLLADLGAEILRIERPGASSDVVTGADPGPVVGRGRIGTIRLDLKTSAGLEALLAILDKADAMIEAFRPGVAERLGFGPTVAMARNPRLVYARLTGWGREGPLAQRAGHDINYTGISGFLGVIGRRDQPPAPPLAISGDMGGGGLFAALGIVSALLERERSGLGQVVDTAMVDGSALLAATFWGYFGQGVWSGQREDNLSDGGAPFYDTYRCKDGGFVALGALEPKFMKNFCTVAGLDYFPEMQDRANWPQLRKTLTALFLTRSRDEWARMAADTDCCLSPVLDFASAPQHPANVEREVFVEIEGIRQPNASPHFSRTMAKARPRHLGPSSDTLRSWGVSEAAIATATGTA